MAEPTANSASSIKSRIAALNLEEVHSPAPGSRPEYSYEHAAPKKARPPPPPPPSKRPPAYQRSETTNNPPLQSHAPASTRAVGNQPTTGSAAAPKKQQPTLPPRPPPRTNSQQAPSLPPRKASEQTLQRRDSAESVSTIASGISSMSVNSVRTSMSNTSNGGGGQMYKIRAPTYDPSKLPPLPVKKAEEPSAVRTALKSTKSSSSVVSERTLPPKLPSRPPLPTRKETNPQEDDQPQPPRKLPPPFKKSALDFGLNKSTEIPPSLPTSRPGDSGQAAGSPPPIPMASRPDLSAIQGSKPRGLALTTCLRCRDFSMPDSHAARFPREAIPSCDVRWLAHNLCSPFASPTDKARVIFTWLHHNIEYNTVAFFNNNVQPSTPASTLQSGLAVCEGYAALFTAIATQAGLESTVVGGSGKGFGHSALKPGDAIPPYKGNHAWNAVKIDNGEWKLIDCCWGAGNVSGANMPYKKDFKPHEFTMDNNEFGRKHFPEDRRHFYRTDGRDGLTWEQYIMDDVPERLQVYGPCTPDHGIGEWSFQPSAKHIKVYDPQNGPMLRFQFASVCPHWDNEKHGKGKPCVMLLHTGGRDGRNADYIPFNTDNNHFWWLDIARADLGAPGQKVSVYSVATIEGRDARGLTVAQYKQKKGKVAMSFGGVAMWELV